MHSDQEKLSSVEGALSSTSAPLPEAVTPSLVWLTESSQAPAGRRFLGGVLFGRKRRATRLHNQEILNGFKGFKLYSILHEMDERLAAANPDYRLEYLALALYRDGKDAQIWITLRSADWPTELDVQMATAIVDNAEKEIREHYGR